jgi:hypothetical protein
MPLLLSLIFNKDITMKVEKHESIMVQSVKL